jgi:hypothetical protein
MTESCLVLRIPHLSSEVGAAIIMLLLCQPNESVVHLPLWNYLQAAVPDTAQSAKGELGNKDAVATGEDCKDDAASRTPPRIDSPSEQPQKKAGQQQQQQPNVASQSPAEASKSYAAELDIDSVQTGKEDRPTVHEPSSTAAIKDNADTSTGDDKPRTESPLSPLHSGSDSTAPAIVAPSNGSAAKSSDNFTFGSALAAKTSASGFGALAGTISE